jgi:hypothetical protein
VNEPPVHRGQAGYINFIKGGRMEDFYDEFRQELFEDLMVAYETQQERQEVLRRMAEEEQLEEDEEV